MAAESWVSGRLVGFDLETTAPDPEEARIVTAAIVVCGGDLGRERIEHSWVVDPGVEVPEEAAAIHGFTTERVQAEGIPTAEALPQILDTLAEAVNYGAPLAIFNARYDLTVLDREVRRSGVARPRPRPERLRVVDPLVLDKWLDRFRRSYPRPYDAETGPAAGLKSSRTLGGMCEHYRASLDDAHEATADALAAARLAWRIGTSGQVVRRVRNAEEGRERAALVRTWQRVRHDLDALHAFQVEIALDERERFADYKASIGEHDEAAKIRSEVGWPVLELRAEGVRQQRPDRASASDLLAPEWTR